MIHDIEGIYFTRNSYNQTYNKLRYAHVPAMTTSTEGALIVGLESALKEKSDA